MFIAVAGNIASGKTTVARLLARRLGWQYAPSEGPDRTYLRDLFREPHRWAMEAQTAFFAAKAKSLQEMRARSVHGILDRSYFEDVQVFGAFFRQAGFMDERAFNTYRAVTLLLTDQLDRPEFIIVCECSVDECRRRMEQRGLRDFERLYTDTHLNDIGELYARWVDSFHDVPMYLLDTMAEDTRVPSTSDRVADDVERLLSRGDVDDTRLKILRRRDGT